MQHKKSFIFLMLQNETVELKIFKTHDNIAMAGLQLKTKKIIVTANTSIINYILIKG